MAMIAGVPADHVVGVLAAIKSVPAEYRMDATALALRAWLSIDYEGGTQIVEAQR